MRSITCSYLALLLGALTSHASAAETAAKGAVVATADMGGSGNTDIVALDPVNQAVDLLWVESDGSFRLTVQNFGDISYMTSLAVADVNGDGRPDVIVTDGSAGTTGVRVLLNNGDGTLAADVPYASDTSSDSGPVSVTAADVNHDGFPDILTANANSGTVSVLFNRGDGSFRTPVIYPAGHRPVAAAAADVNGDGHLDLVVADASGDSVLVLLNDGLGDFAAPLAHSVGSHPVALSVADMDGDGIADIAVADQNDDTVAVLHGNGDGSFLAASFYRTGAEPGWIAAQDLTGSGRLDLVTDNYSDGSVSIFANSGHGFADQQQLFPAYGSYGTVVMNIGGTSQVVSPNIQAGQVQVTPAAAAVQTGNAAQGPVRHIAGAHDPQSSTGDLDGISLALLGLTGFARRRIR
ncbi:MAG TPA: VCBS repeat-containing protein [Gammaproteobacteria bacterium]|nr:VCBS repeat-containing protein [Gammaproteobacteria bacterium]